MSQTSGTSLVTLYVMGGIDLGLITSRISHELATSQNIKNKAVRHNVQSALASGLLNVRSLGHTSPENGFVLCCGEINQCV